MLQEEEDFFEVPIQNMRKNDERQGPRPSEPMPARAVDAGRPNMEGVELHQRQPMRPEERQVRPGIDPGPVAERPQHRPNIINPHQHREGPRREEREQREQDMSRKRERDRERMPLPPRLMHAPASTRGFIGADVIVRNQALFNSPIGFVFFVNDLISTIFGIATLEYMWRQGQPATIVGYIVGIIVGIYIIWVQFSNGPAVWYQIKHRGEIATDPKTGRTYVVAIDPANVFFYLLHIVPDLIGTGLFYWVVILSPILSFATQGNPSPMAFAISVALCGLIALLSSIIPLIILIKNEATSEEKRKGAQGMA